MEPLIPLYTSFQINKDKIEELIVEQDFVEKKNGVMSKLQFKKQVKSFVFVTSFHKASRDSILFNIVTHIYTFFYVICSRILLVLLHTPQLFD